jgi:hypothetical protein
VRLALSARVDASEADIVRVVGDLSTYPQWLGVVQEVEVEGPDAWLVDIGARVGLLRRTKRVRMVRTGALRFERDEADGKEHPPWVLDATVDGSDVRVELFYGGSSLAVSALEPLLRLEAARAPARLQRTVRDLSSGG